MPAYKGVSIHVYTLSFGSIASARIWFPPDFFVTSSKILCGSPLIWFTFLIPSPMAMFTAPEAGTWNSCSGLKKSTQVNWMRKHNNSVYGSSQGSELSPTVKKKKITISLIAAKWHTKRKLTIGCDSHSQSDSDLPAPLSPFRCQVDCSLPISFQPQQPKKALPQRAVTSSLFWY